MTTEPRLSAVTGLYNIGRAGIDGRSIETYIHWLNGTLRLPVDFTIFLDPAIDRALIAAKPGDIIVQKAKEAFYPFTWRSDVERICRTSTKIGNRKNIAYLLPDYGMMVHSKFWMMLEAAKLRGGRGMLWLDAGISRFFDQDLATTTIDGDYLSRLEASSIALHISKTLARELHHGHPREEYVGTASHLATAGDFYVAADSIEGLARAMANLVERQWLPYDLWDNEQVGLGCLLLGVFPRVQIVGASKEFATLAEALFSKPRRHPHRHSTILQRLKWHFGPKATIQAY